MWFAKLGEGLPKLSAKVCPMTADYSALSRAVLARREQLGLTQDEVYAAGGPSNTKISQIEQGKAEVVSASTLRKLDVGLRWAAGTARGIVGGATQDASYVAAPGERVEGGLASDEAVEAIRAVRTEIQQMRADLSVVHDLKIEIEELRRMARREREDP